MRSKIISRVKKIVIKIGTNVVTGRDGLLDKAVIGELAEQVIQLRFNGYYVVIVSSGAIGSGLSELGIRTRPKTLPKLQAAAAVGQCKLISFYDNFFIKYGYHAAQLLLTRQDFEDRRRYLNASNTINALMKFNTIPIINENDTISVDEIAFSDNDILSSLVTNLVQAELFIILSSVDGLYKEISPVGKGTKLISYVECVTSDIKKLAYDFKTERGVGGMQSKLEAVKTATKAGEAVIIANGKEKDILLKIMMGENVGTLFVPAKTRMTCRRRWIRFSVKPSGQIFIDNGAEEALIKNGKSLLASGIVGLKGNFKKGDVVSLIGKKDQVEIGRGLTNYSSDEIAMVKGLKTSEIRKILGLKTYDEVVHRNNLVIDN